MRRGDVWGEWPKEVGPSMGATFKTVQKNGATQCAIAAVTAGSPAAQAGLRQDDIVVQIGDVPMKNRSDALTVLAQFDPGRQTRVIYARSQQRAQIELKLIHRP